MKPRIAVIGVGGAGGNAINNMIGAGLSGAEFIVANTDAQALATSSAEQRIQLGASLTEGLGAGAKPEIGEAAAEEAIEDIRTAVNGCHMVFIAAGMGGGTGTGAVSVVARVAKEFGILTVAVVTKPFLFEGSRRLRTAEAGIAELRRHVDTLLVIPNQNLFRIATDRTTFAEAFVLADQVLYSGIACIVDLIVKEGLINLDLADVRTVLQGMGPAMMGTGEAAGEQRSIVAAEEAIVNPLLDDVTLKGAKSLLLSITGGRDLTLWEVDEAANRVRQEVDPDANIIVGATFDEALGNKVRVSIVASGMARNAHGTRAADPEIWTPRSQRRPPVAAEAPDDFRRRLSEAIDDLNPQGEPPRGPGEVHITARPPQLPVGDRQVPPIEDFPPVAQNEYWAKSPQPENRVMEKQPPFVYQQQPESPPPKTSLLRRLTGGGRGRREEGRDDEKSPRQASRGNRTEAGEQSVDRPVFFGRGKRQ